MRWLLILVFLSPLCISAINYEVGPSKSYTSISDVPWESMNAGDTVFIHYRTQADGGPYKEKWVINVQGTQAMPFVVMGVLGPNGERPVIDGNAATTRTQLSYWNEDRAVIKVGGSSVPSDGMPSHIFIENLAIKSAYRDYGFTDDNGNSGTYTNNAASIYVEKVDHLTIRNCEIHDSGNGVFVAFNSNDVLLESNYIHNNGVVDRFFEHNTYTEGLNLTFQFNRYGPLRPGALGNNLKDRSAGTVIRYNWIQGGNRCLDLVESSNTPINTNPAYRTTHAYGNILIEEDGGNNQVIHYGGDNGNTNNYRKGTFYFYNNTVYSKRAGNTTLMRLSSGDETAVVLNNIIHVTAGGSTLALLENTGTLNYANNIVNPNWVQSHNGSPTGTLNDDGGNQETNDPGFNDALNEDFSLSNGSFAINQGGTLSSPMHSLDFIYEKHLDANMRVDDGFLDIGAFEFNASLAVVEWIPFQAEKINNKVKLTWGTASEIGTDVFMIDRKTDDGIWQPWREIKSKGGLYKNTLYEIMDSEPLAGRSWYRLSEIEYSGRVHVLGMNSVYVDQASFKVYPNPVDNVLFISGEIGDIKSMSLTHMDGKQIQLFKARQSIDLTGLQPGYYVLNIVTSYGYWTKRLMVY